MTKKASELGRSSTTETVKASARDHVKVSFTGTKHVDAKSVLTNNYDKVFSSLKARTPKTS
jgi:hypothetical protein